MPIELLVVLFGGLLFLLGKYGFPIAIMRRKAAVPANGTAPASANPTPTPSLSLMSKIKAGAVGRMSLAILAFLVLGVMIVMFQVLPREFIAAGSGILMTILVGMTLLSLIMAATGWGNRLAWFVLFVGFGTLAWQPIEITAKDVANATATIRDQGLGGAVEKAARSNPVQAPKLQGVIWQPGDIYELSGDRRYLGTLPQDGAIFAQPVHHCVHANAVGGQEATYAPAGTQESNPWGRTLVKPQPSDIGKEFEVWAVRC